MDGFADDGLDGSNRPVFSYYSETGVKSVGPLGDAPEGFYLYKTTAEDRLFDSFNYI